MDRRRVLSALCGVAPLAGCLTGESFGIEDADTTVSARRCVADPASEGSVQFDGSDAVVVAGDLLLHTRCDDVNLSVFTSEGEHGKVIVEAGPVRPTGTDTDCDSCDDQPMCTYESRLTFSGRVTGVDLLHGLPGGGSTDVAVEHRG
jgi:hypothetical protein